MTKRPTRPGYPPRSRGGSIEAASTAETPTETLASIRPVRGAAPLKLCRGSQWRRCRGVYPPRSRGGSIEAKTTSRRSRTRPPYPPRSRGGSIEAGAARGRSSSASGAIRPVRGAAPLKPRLRALLQIFEAVYPPRSRGGSIEATLTEGRTAPACSLSAPFEGRLH